MIRGLSILILFLATSGLWGQGSNRVKEEAKAFFAAEHYEDALNTFRSSRQLSRNDEESRFLMSICYYQLNRLDEAYALFTSLVNEERSPYPECWFYLGKIYHARHQFDEAVDHYKLYLRTLRPEHPNRPMVVEEIRRCDNGRRLFYRDSRVVVENLGPAVNSEGDEYAPVLSPSRSTQLYFSAEREGNVGGPRDLDTRPDPVYGQHYCDMFSTQLEGGQWQQANPLHYLLNSPQHEQLIGFSGYGEVMLFYQGWSWDRGLIFADTFQQADQRSMTTTPLISPVRADLGENSLFLYNDTLLIFAARRPQGYGGLDLYRTIKRGGVWSTPENMGPEINSAFDETTPFLARNGQTLYFSTNDSRKSVGGLDIVRSVYIPEAARWSSPENLGFPINSAADDAHFSLARDGFTGFFASARKDGLGKRDIMVAYFNTYRQEMEPPYVAAVPISPASSPEPPSQVVPQTEPEPIVVAPNSSPVTIVPSSTVTPDPVTENRQWSFASTALSGLSSANGLDASLQQAIGNLQAAPSAHLVISCYVPRSEQGSISEALFAASQIALEVARRVQAAGVADHRIYLRTLLHSTQDYRLALSFTHLNDQGQNWPVIGQRDGVGIRGVSADQALCYKVQVVAVQRNYRNADMDQRPDLMLEHSLDFPYYRYTIGAATTYEQANQLRRQLLNAGYNGAYVVPYVEGRRIDKDRARQLTGRFPNLAQYLGQ